MLYAASLTRMFKLEYLFKKEKEEKEVLYYSSQEREWDI